MSECKKIKRLLSRYLDKEISEEDSVFIKTHLERCSFCMNELLALNRVKDFVLKKERKSFPPDYLFDRLNEEISRKKDAEGSLPWIVAIGNLSRKLIPVPVTAIVLSMAFLLLISRQQADKYSLEEHLLDGSQTTTEIALGVILGA